MRHVHHFGAFELRPADRLLLQDGREVAIGGRAFDLLCVLVRRQPQVVSMVKLLEAVWPRAAVEPNNVQVQIWALRKLLGARAIVTVPRRGYRFMPDRVGIPLPPHQAVGPLPPLSTGPLADWAAMLSGHRLLTLVGDRPAALRERMDAMARAVAARLGGVVWTFEAGASDAAAAALARRLRTRDDVVVMAPGAHAPDLLRRQVGVLLDLAPAIRCLAAARQALGHPEEVAHPVGCNADLHAAAFSAEESSLLRSRPRAR